MNEHDTCVLHEEMKETLKDHEHRIRNLEDTTHELKFQLANIEKNQVDLKAIVLDVNREQSKSIKTLMDSLLSITGSAVNSTSEIRLIDRKEFWGIVALIIGGLITYLAK